MAVFITFQNIVVSRILYLQAIKFNQILDRYNQHAIFFDKTAQVSLPGMNNEVLHLENFFSRFLSLLLPAFSYKCVFSTRKN